jgi:hypothetical protein
MSPADQIAYEAVTLRDGNVCQKCHRVGAATQRDHRKNRSQGGKTTLANLQLLCVFCHDWKTSNPRRAIAEGWACPGWADPQWWPARRWMPTTLGTKRPAWVYYDDNGDFVEITELEARSVLGTYWQEGIS